MFRHSFVFRSGTSVVCVRVNGDAAARGEDSRNLNVLGIHQTNEVFHYNIYAILVESAMITETEKIEFQAFALHHFHIGDVADTDFRKIRLSRYGAKAGELRTIETHPIIITGMLIVKRFQYFGGIILLILRFSSQ